MKKINQGFFTGERALYNERGLDITDSVFEDGESPLKECSDITVGESIFKWKYPIWYSKNVCVTKSTFLITARSGIWYTDGITLEDCTVDAPKTFRRSSNITVKRCTFPNAEETLWSCKDVDFEGVSVSGDYFGMNCDGFFAKDLYISGNYAFDGGRNIEIDGARLISKDAFWNCENVTVRNAVIIGEYLGWNSKNVKFINCTIESNQGLCYMDGVTLENCQLINTDLAFELSVVDADITTSVVSVKNPVSGKINAKSIGEIILDSKIVDPAKTKITTED